MPKVTSALAVALLLCGAACAQVNVSQINISQDLVSLGIAGQNAVPNAPNLDTRPLLQAAIQYATANGIPKVIADQGAYWFLTAQKSDRYLVLNQLSDLTIDLQNSDLFLKNSFLIGFDLENCTRVTLANFTVDSMQLPFTQVRLTGVNGRFLTYETSAGWPSPKTLRSPFGGTDFWGLVLRGGSVPANTSRLPLFTPTDSSTLQVKVEDSPWTQPAILQTYQAGDIIVVTLKDGDAPIYVGNGDGVVLSGIDIFSSGTLGVHVDGSKNSTISRIRVLPRPGSGRLISTNADGIHVSFSQANNRIQGCFITRTLDDAIAVSSEFLAFVSRQLDNRTVNIVRNFNTRIPNGTQVGFLNPNTGAVAGVAYLVAQNPPYELVSGAATPATYTFDSDLPTLKPGFGLIFNDPANLGQGSVVESNLVEDILFGRGIFIGGSNGLTVQKNTIRRTNGGGIVLHHDLASYPSAANQNVQIISNTVDGAIGPAAVGTGTIAALGAIFVLSTDTGFTPLTSPSSTNISITNNYISNAGRTGIWVGQVDGGTVQGNTFAGVNLFPQLAFYGVLPSSASQLTQDFTQAVVVRSSRNVSVQNQ